MYEVYDEKLRLGDLEIADRDLSEFIKTKCEQSATVDFWSDSAQNIVKRWQML